jgi:hypothetical protein
MTRSLRRLAALSLAALVASQAPLARAEGPVDGGDLEQQVREVALKISRALKENEAHLARLARGDEGKPSNVDIKIPETGSESSSTGSPTGEGGTGTKEGEKEGETGSEKESGGGASEGMKELLDSVSRSGKSASEGIGELLRLAQSMGNQGGGAGEPGEKPNPGDGEEKDPGKKENDPKSEAPEEKGDEKPGSDDPKDGRKNDDPVPPGTKPPTSDKAPPTAKDLEGVFFVRLPAKVREAIRNGDFDRVPEKYRAMVAEWTRLLSEQDAEDARRGE